MLDEKHASVAVILDVCSEPSYSVLDGLLFLHPVGAIVLPVCNVVSESLHIFLTFRAAPDVRCTHKRRSLSDDIEDCLFPLEHLDLTVLALEVVEVGV